MFSERMLSALIVVFVVVITTGFLIARDPEESHLSSSDGALTVTGLARQTQPLTIENGGSVRSPLFGNSYRVRPDSVTLDEPAVIAFGISEDQADRAGSLGIYRFHPGIRMWELVAPVVSHTNDVLAVETAQLGEFALGEVVTFDAPVFANVYDELRAMAPANAVGYEIAVGFTSDEGELVRLRDTGELGGCNGTVGVGDGEQTSRLERQARVQIGDVQRTLRFVFVTRWFTSSAGGCVDESVIMPLPAM